MQNNHLFAFHVHWATSSTMEGPQNATLVKLRYPGRLLVDVQPEPSGVAFSRFSARTGRSRRVDFISLIICSDDPATTIVAKALYTVYKCISNRFMDRHSLPDRERDLVTFNS
jgi:hypothetical protein